MKVSEKEKKAKTVVEEFDSPSSTPVLELLDELFTPPLGTATIGVVR